MPLLSLWRSNPETITSLNLQQIVSNAGDGDLRDQSDCSEEFRAYLKETRTEKLAQYVEQCLSSALNKGGYILQDLVNELGRRLDYIVQNGRYTGVSNQVGFDGLWAFGSAASLVVEVKTTDAYRVSLDTLIGYRKKMLEQGLCGPDASILIVVGRQDTGELEAQIRGSRHAWDIRLISAEALLRLVAIKERAGQAETDHKIRGILRPAEYTRLDGLVDVVFSAARERDAEALSELPVSANEVISPGDAMLPGQSAEVGGYEFTPSAELSQKKEQVVSAWSRRTSIPLVAKGGAFFWSGDHQRRVICALSKRYVKFANRPYWYAYHPSWREFIRSGKEGHLLLGMMDRNIAFALPANRLEPLLERLNTTYKPDGKTYWHLHLREDSPGQLGLYVPGGEQVPLDTFGFALS